jgi:hypothetical protein
MALEIDQRDFDGRAILVTERVLEVLEAAAQCALRGEENL